jgi:hypothetical protein
MSEDKINIAPSGELPVWVDADILEGRKFDSEKPKMHLLPPNAIIEVSKVLTFGAEKYDEENWRRLENAQNRYTSGALRHIFAHMSGELQDEETNYSHLAHAICCLMFKLELELENGKKECKEEGLREAIEREYREGDRASKPQFFPEGYNKERGL